MKHKLNPFSRKLRQFKNVANEIQTKQKLYGAAFISSGHFRFLLAKLKKLFAELIKPIGHFHLKKILAGCSLSFFMFMNRSSSAQEFATPVSNPFTINISDSYISFPSFADIDDDGDQDMFMTTFTYADSGNVVLYYENIGNDSLADYNNPVNFPPGSPLESAYVTIPEFADYDGDGDFDMIYSQYGPTLSFFENSGSANSPQFTTSPFDNPFGLIPFDSSYVYLPTLVDIDDDADLDIFIGTTNGLFFSENTGTPSLPAFSTPLDGAFGIASGIGYYPMTAFGDLDFDSDLDLVMMTVGGLVTQFFENIGSANSPLFTDPLNNAFGIANDGYQFQPELTDIDGDGDLDLFSGHYQGSIIYQENIDSVPQPPNSILMIEKNTFQIFPNPASDQIMISIPHNAKGDFYLIEILNANGEIVFVEKIRSQNYSGGTINTKDFSAGTYVIRLTSSEKIMTRKMLKN